MQVEQNTSNVKFYEIAIGECFEYKDALYMRTDMSKDLCNASIVKDVNARGDGYATNMHNGAVSIWTRHAYVNPVIAKVRVTG